ncbi:sulfurtransferase [Youngiibacter fragilis]|uniref:3-mercaptopyruvate sulfurtransferase n=1 Tax=Youngiibacter fragilis 232.1 TaxID=994573 RepID=V7I7F2_9CLOT|nr:rhodanese-like domain-containing protein [Youngiibacter fragilis]ETA80957.1 3-mercaptopyruvate sulfurtransferase [Youngiibacter fragilis 232.1]
MNNFKDIGFLRSETGLTVIDARKRDAYLEDHYRGSYNLDLDLDLAGPVLEHGGRHPLPDTAVFQEKLRSIGLRDGSSVMIYDNGGNDSAGRLWWMLKYYGMKDIFVLLKGYSEFSDEEKDSKVPGPAEGTITLVPDETMTAPYEEILEYSKQDKLGGKAVVDSRSEERWRGLVEPIDRKKGRIPNTINIFYRKCFNTDNSLKDMDFISASFKKALAFDDVIFHCGSGVTACTNIMLFDELGRKSRLYVGSFSDYISYDNEPLKE